MPNITIGAPVVKSLRSHLPNAFLDCHMMVSEPGKVSAEFSRYHIQMVSGSMTWPKPVLPLTISISRQHLIRLD